MGLDVVTLVNEIRGCLSELVMLRSHVAGVGDVWLKKINDIDAAFKNMSLLDKRKRTELLSKTKELETFCIVFTLFQPFVQSLCDILKISANKQNEQYEWEHTIDAMNQLYVNSKFIKDHLHERETIACSFCDVFMSVFGFDYVQTENGFADYDSRKQFIQGKLVSTGVAMETFYRTLFRYSDDDESNKSNQLLFAEIKQIISALQITVD